ncbi:hypothetical protein JL193_15910 [Polaribacter batillariae]|uniref:Alpha/beta hydrolase n=1 Tax=Polaribacter batillariae TaxID=2808900 RepID=A0ABX7STP4_9FLAO|nr:hypothetical protein [Polaribacter batillariae]QTD37541.1 hypothetical protein JL193_15910 [Polaribacter batillariae]
MKTITLVICICISTLIHAQKYSFIPDSLKLITMDKLMKKPLPTSLDLVYYEDGTKTTLKEVMPLVIQQKLQPHMFVDKDGNYIALVVAKSKTKAEDIRIRYKNMPESLQKLGYSFGNPNSNTVIINTQGGPMINLLTDSFKSIFKEAGDINEDKYFLINVHQAQTLKPEKFIMSEISFEQAKAYSKETSKMLYDLISYFKSENKKVYIVGISFGSFVGEGLIAEYGNIADGYLLAVGRLDMTEEIWKAYSKGIAASFKEDAINVVVGSRSDDEVTTVNIRKIAAGFGHNRYTKLLENTDLSNLTYLYAKSDQNVGKLTDDEIKFLKSKGANVIGFEGGHRSWTKHLKEGIDLLLKN